MTPEKRPLLVVGATGLVGSLFLRWALADPDGSEVHTLARRATDDQDRNLREHVADSDRWADVIAQIRPATVFCALGTTIRQAGSQSAFRAVDYDLVTAVGHAARAGGATHFIAISSAMADAMASSFYLRTKGEAEDALTAAGFERLDLLRPGLLRGQRSGPPRWGESFAMAASPILDRLLHGGLRKYRSIRAVDVAACAYKLTQVSAAGRFVHGNDEMLDILRTY